MYVGIMEQLGFMALGHDLQPLWPYHLLARVSLYVDVVDLSLIFKINHPPFYPHRRF